ncbi:MAG: DUF5695 domain-containing protein [Acidobacteriaceae bacterium]
MLLDHPSDPYQTNFVVGSSEHPEFAVADSRWFGDVVFRFRRAGGSAWQHASTAHSRDARTMEQSSAPGVQRIIFHYRASASADGIRGFDFDEEYELHGDVLLWSLTLRNVTNEPLEIGDIGLPLLFNTIYARAPKTTYQKRVIRHSYIAGDNSFIYWTRANGVGPYLLMTPRKGTHLEFFEPTVHGNHADSTDPVFYPRNAWGGLYTAYILAAAEARDFETQGTWRQPLTSKVLTAQGSPGSSVTYAFEFRWAANYHAIRKLLYQVGMIDVTVVPGMVIPTDLTALVALHTRESLDEVKAEYPKATTVTALPFTHKNTYIYHIRFHRLGENEIKISFGHSRRTVLEYDVIEPLETVIRKRSKFLVEHQQVHDPEKWYDGEFSLWDMRARVLRTPDNLGGLDPYMVGGSDDPDLCKAPYIAAVNEAYPNNRQIAAVEYYLKHFVWGKLQRTGEERPFPYGIYGSPNWHVNRFINIGYDSGGNGREHMWRTFDYTHLVQLYYEMYRIAKLYPERVHYLDASGYLERAYRTSLAYFRVPYHIRMGAPWDFRGWTDWAYTQGAFHEVFIPDVIDALEAEHRPAEASELRAEWNKKVMYFLYDAPYPYGSEMWFDTTAFESTQAIARYAALHGIKPDNGLWRDKNNGQLYSHPHVAESDVTRFMRREIEGNIAARGTLETNYYQLGSDIRQGGSSNYLLSYMTQMGGWAVLDYGLEFAKGIGRDDALRLGYASYLAGWALVNAGPPESDYGYWFQGADDDGAAGWGFNPAKYGGTWIPGDRLQARGLWPYDGEIDSGFSGALRAAATIVVDDPMFGVFAYGGDVQKLGAALEIELRDGLEQRLDLLELQIPLRIHLNRDGFSGRQRVEVNAGCIRLQFRIESRDDTPHSTTVSADGLTPGNYEVSVANGRTEQVRVAADGHWEQQLQFAHANQVTELRLDGPVTALRRPN